MYINTIHIPAHTYVMEYCSAIKKEWNLAICDIMGPSRALC